MQTLARRMGPAIHLPRYGYAPPRNRSERRGRDRDIRPAIVDGISGYLDCATGVFLPKIAGGAVDTPAQPAVVAALPFTGSAHDHTEPAFTYTFTPGAAVQRPNPIDIPAYGYIQHVLLEVTASGGSGGTIAADGPWNIIQEAVLQDVNGANIVNPLDGYSLYLANVLGGYGFQNDPALAPDHVGSAPNPKFFIRIPVQISERDALGALANQNAAANYKLALAFNTLAAAFSVAPGTPPAITVRGWLEAWTLPAPVDAQQRPQAQVPPLLGTGQFWSSSQNAVLAGNIPAVQVRRVGNYIRSLILVGRDVSGVRSNAVFPDPLMMTWDGNQMHNISLAALRFKLREKINGPFTLPTGVIAIPYNDGGYIGKLGNETPDGWLPTSESSRIEFSGNNSAAGSIQLLVNEVAPVETNQAERYQTPSDTSNG